MPTPDVAIERTIKAVRPGGWLLFGWRRAALRRAREGAADAPGFAPVMLEAPAGTPRPPNGAILEILFGAMVARVPLTADAATLARIVRALKEAT